MLKRSIILISLFTLSHAFAADVLIKAGANNSWFANEGGTSVIKPAAGIGVRFSFDESQEIKLGVDVLYVGQKMILKGKSWKENTTPGVECEVTIGDLYLHYHYFKVPIYLDAVVYQTQNITATFNVGLSINLTLASSSDGENYRFVEDYCDYDYKRVNFERQPKYPSELIVGAGIAYKKIGLDLHYSSTLGKTEFLNGLSIQDNIHSFRIMLSWYLKGPALIRKQN